jgi:cullin-5
LESKTKCYEFCTDAHIKYFLQEAIIKILKMRKRITNVQLQTELVDILKNMFLPSKKMIKEQIEWLIEHKYMKRDEDDINTFIYMA